jgi:hypothetical protein
MHDGRKVIGFGLSEENRRRLALGEPIYVQGHEVDQPGLAFLIFAGSDERQMVDQLKNAGMKPPETGWPA